MKTSSSMARHLSSVTGKVIALFFISATLLISPVSQAKEARAIFAGGCFWCMEPPFDSTEGVISTTSGYTDGHKQNPTYREVSAGMTGHTEAVEIIYDPEVVSYQTLLDIFWVNIDPFAVNRQFCDAGRQYRSGIYPLDDEQSRLAEISKAEHQQNFNQKIQTEIKPASTFYPAEDYHQDYYMKNPIRYTFYRSSCGRDNRLKEVWGDKFKKH
ncbi:peptide-methionine (S)-S-oxide reductase MsrA [Oceanospirillum linum]|nr:peptide-methionine (S)-S-oxide reductase MsrA [Oceanospirillum linum]SEG47920.1 peptide-methionine (S)-S-oxide reductase [Oleiphilus messinensis]SMP31206.1 peptide-methionine (S)-S-oxide reductase [Oceanospirillum linum]